MKTYTNEERRDHVAAWKTSGLARSAYAKEKGIHPATFCKWAKDSEQKGRGFVELSMEASYQGRQEIIIEKGDIYCFRFENLQKTTKFMGILFNSIPKAVY